MHFLPTPEPNRPPPGDRRWWLPVLFASAIVGAAVTRWPWIQVKFERLFGGHVGPPGWQTTAGFTCLCTSALVAVLALAETRTPSSKQAVRPGSVMLVSLATLALLFDVLSGPGTLRGVSAEWTIQFYIACFALPLLLISCLLRWRAMHYSPQTES